MAPSPMTRSQTELTKELKTYLESMKVQIIASFQQELKEVKASISTLGKRISDMDEDLKNMKSDILRIDFELNTVKHRNVVEGPDPKLIFESVMDEMNQINIRKKNVVIHGIPEKEDGSLHEREDHDREKCQEILDDLELCDVNIRSTRRLGKSRGDGKRLLKVEFAKKLDKRNVLKRSGSLRNGRFAGVYINPDRTPMEQKNHRKLREELRRRRQEGEDVVIFRGSVIPKSSKANFQ